MSGDLFNLLVGVTSMVLNPWAKLSPVLYFLNLTNIFRQIFVDPTEKRTAFNKLNKLSINIDKYYSFTVPKNMINTIFDDMVIGSFTKDINNNKDDTLRRMSLLKDSKLRDYIIDAFKDHDNFLLRDVHMSFSRDMIEFTYEGYKYELKFSNLIIGQLDGESGSGKSTISKILTGYIDYDFASAEGMSATEGNVKSPIYKMDPRSKSLIPLFSNDYTNLLVDYTMDFVLGIAKFDYWKQWIDLTSLFNISEYQTSVDVPIKFLTMSNGQRSRLEGAETMMRILDLMETGNSFIGIFDELSRSLDKKNSENVLNVIRNLDKYVNREIQASHVTENKAPQNSFIILMIDHSDLGKKMLVYDFIMNIEDKTIKLYIKDPVKNKYVKIEDLFRSHKNNSVKIGNFEITRNKLDSGVFNKINKDIGVNIEKKDIIDVDTSVAAA